VLPIGGVSPQTEQVLGHFSCQEGNDKRTTAAGLDPGRPLCRIERIVVKGELEHTTDVYSSMSGEGVVLPEIVRACSSAMESYLRSLKFDVRLSPDAIRPPQDHHHLSNAACRFYLSPTTQNDLAVVNDGPSATFGQHGGSLFSMMNHTRTVFGARLLKNWLLFPQRSIRKIEERQDCVELLSCVSGEGASIYEALREEILPASAATERLLQQLHLRRATPISVFRLVRALHRVEKNINHLLATTTSSSTAVHKLLLEYPRNSEALEAALQSIVVDTAHNTHTEYAVSKAWARHPLESRQYEDIVQKIGAVEQDFQAILVTYRHTLNLPTLAYTSHRSSGIGKMFAHLIAVNRADLKRIPDDWLLMSSTKTIVRYYPPRVRALQLEQDVLTEKKAQLVALVWQKTLAAVDSAIYMKGIRSVDTLAQLDCFASLATVSRLFPNYVRPSFATTTELTIVGGRHPTLDLLSPQGCSYIPGDVALNGAERGEVMIVSGPNMGGKSTMLRMVALLVVMAQMGSFVPATSLTLSPFDAIHTRMHRRRDANVTGWSGAGDDELLSLSALTTAATSKSLVLLDEVGYGLTSQQARSLAFHIVKHLVKQVRCRVLMATHLVDIVQRFFDNGFSHKEVQSKVLAHQVDKSPSSDMDPTTQVVYHYTTRDGVANKSLALQVASASGLPEAILTKAAEGCWWQTTSD
jgi:DNA mismatch repair protein MSH3